VPEIRGGHGCATGRNGSTFTATKQPTTSNPATTIDAPHEGVDTATLFATLNAVQGENDLGCAAWDCERTIAAPGRLNSELLEDPCHRHEDAIAKVPEARINTPPTGSPPS
jgi:hypothetical protein